MAQGGPLARYPWLRRLVGPLLFVVLFVLFLLSTFPYDDLGLRLEQEARAQNAELSIGRLRGAGLFGLRASDVKVRLPGPPGGEPGPEIKLDEVDVRPDLFGLIVRRTGFGYSIDGYGGTAKGHATLAKDQRQGALDKLTLTANDLDLKSLPIKDTGGVDLSGKASLKIDFTKMSPTDQATGLVSITGSGLAASGSVKGLTLPKLNAGNLDVQLTLDKGNAHVDRASLRGGDLEVDADGSIRLKPLLTLSQVELHTRLKLGDAWLNANPIFKTLLTAVNNARQPDGSYVFTLTGPLANLNPPRPGR
jgi:type II secretion system protein N